MSTYRPRRPRSLLLLVPLAALFAVAATAQPVPVNRPGGPGPVPQTTTASPTTTGPASAAANRAVVPAASPDGMVGPIKFGDITVDSALEMLERWSGRAVLRPAGLPATSLSFSLNQKVTKEEAIEALETLLTLNGIAVSPLGTKFLKVTPLNTARTEAPDFIEGSTLGLPPSGRIAAKLFQLEFLRVAEFMPQIAGILNPAAAAPPVLFEKANAALVTDSVSNLQRIEALVAKLDQPALQGLTPKFYKVVNTTASELVTKLQSIISGAAATQLGTTTSIQSDDRTNQVILLSDPRQFAFFDDLIAKLDTPGESSTRQEVIQLKHATASDVATVITSLVTGQNSAARNATQNQAGRNVGAVSPANRTGPNPPTPNGPSPAQLAAQQAIARAQINMTAVAAGLNLAGGAASVSQQFSQILTVVPDERSNSLVVSGTVDDLRLIKDIVSQLDILLAQVRIEVVIAEITLTDASATGIEALGLVLSGNKLVAFNGSAPGVTVSGAPNATTGATTPYATLYDPTGARDLAATLSLGVIPRKSNTNILSVPNIVTTHNKEATIFVGESRPVITSYQNTGTLTGNVGAGYTSNVTYKDIGVSLTVKPLIGNDGSVQLDIKQDVNDILDEVVIDGNSQPVIGSRKTESFISVKSGEIAVLGGLQRKSYNRSTSRFAGIPLLGDLLGKRSRTDTRTDLVFFLRPYILTNTAADNAEALERLKHSPQHDDVQSALKGTLPGRQ
ncbi:MAG TPA: secretin N-terminal domain-containing protein [Lacunisphaera sp.]|nr:secretin N-terminal domain-containing protein [Lacunisphaera sp.]